MKTRLNRFLSVWLLACLLGPGAVALAVPPHITNNENAKPSLLPEPAELQWRNESFDLRKCRAILYTDRTMLRYANLLQTTIFNAGAGTVRVRLEQPKNGPYIELVKSAVKAPVHEDEAYLVEVSEKKITLTAGTEKGMYYAIQTLQQLMTGKSVQGCSIRDWPAFSWRSYMVDVGRNYQPMALLKQQIDVMSRYKMNVFHFHFTEDVAWRLHFKRYPQLTDAKNMIRQKGKFYSEKDLHELIEYCRLRHIELVPEIDMPGHSAAFRRAMGHDMQSDSGMAIIQNIVRDFCEAYKLPYLHIGADEVKITNKNFLPDMTKLVESYGTKVIGWMPGGNFPESVIRQLWSEGKIESGDGSVKYIDSRQLYINHMDPLESVTSIFQRQLCNSAVGNASELGATLCLWHDRNVAKEEDVMIMNPAYPALLTFAERTWRGGGTPGIKVAIGPEIAADFATFEIRLMDHKQKYFKGMPFGYFPQSAQQWQLYGPFPNNGDPGREFDTTGVRPSQTATGGTIILRHWWWPELQGVLSSPAENTTYYASTRIWSDRNGETDCWIGFHDFSRSHASLPPTAGKWDNRGSSIRVNGELIPPPVWESAGKTITLETPYTNEGYAYRTPTKVRLKKGWNIVEVKAPVTTFKGRDWQNPVKWMFTFVPCRN
ncbi:family 20 glycosylhydrolase [Chitinophaga caseinilytica]|uniref:family 20 glycosylhydrolase n=1 Tax=Chitinophaga caseinilytica TaxID=2267521 RepID=UPI003C307724